MFVFACLEACLRYRGVTVTRCRVLAVVLLVVVAPVGGSVAVAEPASGSTSTPDSTQNSISVSDQPSTQDSALSGVSAQSEPASFTDVDPSDLNGTGSQSDPYEISNASELQAMEDDLDAHYELISDINASSTTQWNNGKGFDPVGRSTNSDFTPPPFTGSLNGNDHTISGITINRKNQNNIGLFGAIGKSAAVTNISLTNTTVTAELGVGGLVGKIENNGTVASATSSGNISGDVYVGGLVGMNVDSGIVTNATASGSVSGNNSVGGLVGLNSGGTIRSAKASADVAGGSEVGGLTGNHGAGSVIQNTFAVGSVSGDGDIGGLTGDDTNAFENTGTTKNSYWDIKTTGQSNSEDSATGLTTAQMQGQAARTNMSGLDFGSVWQTQPNDYPTLVALQQSPEKKQPQPPASITFANRTVPNGSTTVTVESAQFGNQSVSGEEFVVVVHNTTGDTYGSGIGTKIGESDVLSAGTHQNITVNLSQMVGSADDTSELRKSQPLVAMLHRANTTDSNGINHGTAITRNGSPVTSRAQVTVNTTDGNNGLLVPFNASFNDGLAGWKVNQRFRTGDKRAGQPAPGDGGFSTEYNGSVRLHVDGGPSTIGVARNTSGLPNGTRISTNIESNNFTGEPGSVRLLLYPPGNRNQNEIQIASTSQPGIITGTVPRDLPAETQIRVTADVWPGEYTVYVTNISAQLPGDDNDASTPEADVNASASTVTPDTVETGETEQYGNKVVVDGVPQTTGEVDIRINGFELTGQSESNGDDVQDLTIDFTEANISDGTLTVSGTVNATAPATVGEYEVYVTDLRVQNDSSDDLEYLIDDASIPVANITVVESLDGDTTPPNVTDATASGLTGDGIVVNGEDVRVATNVSDAGSGVGSVTANASAFGAGTVSLDDADGDGRYTGTFTIDASAAAPPDDTYAIPITAADAAGNVNESVAAGPLEFDDLDTVVSLTPADKQLVSEDTATFDVVVDNATNGVGAWELTVTQTGDDVVNITDVSLSGDPFQQTVTIGPDNNSVYADAAGADTNDTGSVTIGTVTVASDKSGSSALDLDVTSLGTEAGFNYDVTNTENANLSTTETTPPEVSAATAAGIGGDGTVVDGEEVTVAVNVTDTQSGVGSVIANASSFGAGTVRLDDATTDGRYTATFTVDASEAAQPETAYQIPINATDNAGNTNRTVAAGPLKLGSVETAVSIVPSSQQVTATNTTTFDIVVEDATGGIGAWTLNVTQSGGAAANITNVSLNGTPEQQTVSIAANNDSVSIEATDGDTADTGRVPIATITVAGDEIGESAFDLNLTNVETEAGFTYNVTATGGAELTTTPPAVRSIYTGPPTDIDGDGQFEDINGNGNFTIVDVQAFYASRESAAIQNYPERYNYNDIGDVDIVDVQRLYFELQQQEQEEEQTSS